jgi:hypothetical protein
VTNHDDSGLHHHPTTTRGFTETVNWNLKRADKTIKNLVTHVPHTYYQRTRVPREQTPRSRKTFWTYQTCLCLRHVGDVTVVLSKKGRNLGPKQTKILVTNLAELTSSQVVGIYQKRWAVGVSREGFITQLVQVQPRPRDASLVA